MISVIIPYFLFTHAIFKTFSQTVNSFNFPSICLHLLQTTMNSCARNVVELRAGLPVRKLIDLEMITARDDSISAHLPPTFISPTKPILHSGAFGRTSSSQELNQTARMFTLFCIMNTLLSQLDVSIMAVIKSDLCRLNISTKIVKNVNT